MSATIESLLAENKKLREALLLAIPWIGENREGPSWATAQAKKKNAAMCVEALNAAMRCLPDMTRHEFVSPN
jgi:hypothetical protein